MVWLNDTDVPVTVEGEAAAPKVAVAVMVKGVAALTTVTTPAEFTVATLPVVSLLVQVTYGVRAPLAERVVSPGKLAVAMAWKVVPAANEASARLAFHAEGGGSGSEVEHDRTGIAGHSAALCRDGGVADSGARRAGRRRY